MKYTEQEGSCQYTDEDWYYIDLFSFLCGIFPPVIPGFFSLSQMLYGIFLFFSGGRMIWLSIGSRRFLIPERSVRLSFRKRIISAPGRCLLIIHGFMRLIIHRLLRMIIYRFLRLIIHRHVRIPPVFRGRSCGRSHDGAFIIIGCSVIVIIRLIDQGSGVKLFL